MLIRHCDQCNMALQNNQPYIHVSFEADASPPSICVGFPLPIQGDYCGVGCLNRRIYDVLERPK